MKTAPKTIVIFSSVIIFIPKLQTSRANVMSSLKTLNKLPSTRLSVQLKNGRLEVLELVALFLLKTETYEAKKLLRVFRR